MRVSRMVMCGVAVLSMMCLSANADQYGLEKGTPEMKSAGPMTFGPDGILFVADTKGAAVFAISTNDMRGNKAPASVNIPGLNVKLAQALNAESDAVTVMDLAVNRDNGQVYLTAIAGLLI